MFRLSTAVGAWVTAVAAGMVVGFVRFLSQYLKSVHLVDNVFLYVVRLKCRFHLKINTIYSAVKVVCILYIVYKFLRWKFYMNNHYKK